VTGIDSLKNVLELERRKGYTDRAVIGGLDKYLHSQAGQIRQSINNAQLLKGFDELNLAKSDYGSCSIGERKIWIAGIFAWVLKVEGTPKSTPTVPSPSRERNETGAAAGSGQRRREDLDSPITVIKGISISAERKFAKFNVRTVRDLLYFFPRRYVDYSQRKPISELIDGEEQTTIGTIWQARVATLGNRQGTEAIIGDETGNIRAVWFNQPYLARSFRTNARIVISGPVGLFRGHRVFESPEWELLGDKELIHTGRLVPVYPLTRGLYPRQVRKWTKETVDGHVWQLSDFLPSKIKTRCQLLSPLPSLKSTIRRTRRWRQVQDGGCHSMSCFCSNWACWPRSETGKKANQAMHFI